MEVIVLIAILSLPFVLVSRVRKRRLRSRVRRTAEEVGLLVTRHFLTQPCARCHEFEMTLLSVSPNARSAHYACTNCGRKMHAAASSEEAFLAGPKYDEFQSLIATFNGRYSGNQIEVTIVFCTPEAPLPFEQTRREPINEAVRTEVWRRDGGRCVQCGSNQNLQFDHIIPVARGGATAVANLQLLCKSCNLGKGAKI